MSAISGNMGGQGINGQPVKRAVWEQSVKTEDVTNVLFKDKNLKVDGLTGKADGKITQDELEAYMKKAQEGNADAIKNLPVIKFLLELHKSKQNSKVEGLSSNDKELTQADIEELAKKGGNAEELTILDLQKAGIEKPPVVETPPPPAPPIATPALQTLMTAAALQARQPVTPQVPVMGPAISDPTRGPLSHLFHLV